MQDWLPLFPLQVVLLPEAELPLHIFETRYKEMMAEALQQGTEFGVVLAHEQGLVSTGCTAAIGRLLRHYPDGRMDLLTVGRRRFEIVRMNEERSFLRVVVDFFDDEDSSPPGAEARRQAIDGYNELRALAFDAPLPESEADHPQLSFRLAKPVSDLNLRQVLLVARSEAERIRRLAAFFPAHLSRHKRIQHVKAVAPRNGHGGHTELE